MRVFVNPLSTFALFLAFLTLCSSKCRQRINQSFYPEYADIEPFELGVLTACKDYISPGRLGCCNKNSDASKFKNFKQIDSIFGEQGGGCQICAINLKRFWCEYTCSPNQHLFMDVGKEYEAFPDPQKPGNIIYGQRVNVRVHVDTACMLFSSCKRNPFVAAVSAMGSPAGFLNFQGHNTINDGHQYISMNFSYNLNDSISFSDSINDFPYNRLTACDFKTSESQLHNFTIGSNCTCSSCEDACDLRSGFQYSQSDVMEDFNYQLVGGVYMFAILTAGSLTYYRHRRKIKQNK